MQSILTKSYAWCYYPDVCQRASLIGQDLIKCRVFIHSVTYVAICTPVQGYSPRADLPCVPATFQCICQMTWALIRVANNVTAPASLVVGCLSSSRWDRCISVQRFTSASVTKDEIRMRRRKRFVFCSALSCAALRWSILRIGERDSR